MQSITALAHLNACILFFVDISETCGHTIVSQVKLFKNIKPLFQAKPLVIVLSKVDLTKYKDLDKESKDAIEEIQKEHNAFVIQMSNSSQEGIQEVKSNACKLLLDMRLTQKAKDSKKIEGILNRMHVAQPKGRQGVNVKPNVPESVLLGDTKKEGPTIKQLQEEYGGAGVFNVPIEEHYMLEKEEWRYDAWPEFYNGSNVLDYYDADIEAKLQKLEDEEDLMLKMEADQADLDSGDSEMDEAGITDDMLALAIKKVRGKKAILKEQHKLKSKRRAKSKLRKIGQMEQDLESKGIAVNKETLRERVRSRKTIMELEAAQEKRDGQFLDSDDEGGEMMGDDSEGEREAGARGRKRTRKYVEEEDNAMEVEGVVDKRKRTLTAPALKRVAASKLRSFSQGRREGSTPRRDPIKNVTEEQIRMSKKIVKKVF